MTMHTIHTGKSGKSSRSGETSAWQPIADAPQDGADVLVIAMPGGRQLVAHYSTDALGWVAVDDARLIYPTHWQPLPAPPAEEAPTPPEPAAAPVLTSLDPASAALGSPSFTLHVHGQDFTPDAIIVWNGGAEATTVLSATEVTTGVNMDTAQVALTIPVEVRNGDGQTSNMLAFDLTEPDVPVATRRKKG